MLSFLLSLSLALFTEDTVGLGDFWRVCSMCAVLLHEMRTTPWLKVSDLIKWQPYAKLFAFFPRSLQLCSIICWKYSEELIMCHGDSFCSNIISSSIKSTWAPRGAGWDRRGCLLCAFLSPGQNSISDVGSYSLQTWYLTLKPHHILRY